MIWFISIATDDDRFVGIIIIEARSAEAAGLRCKALGHTAPDRQLLLAALTPKRAALYRGHFERLLNLAEAQALDSSIRNLGEQCDEMGIDIDSISTPGILGESD